ncbi:PfkB family carbohydrate kinase [Arthrobacter tumbae]|uniref:PfkB family carbohydrate kinase n=1 Tax=Arthrobacter tumbae TaxID=163874 RepID=UPI0019564F10|nr:PfkB family carbohydrate kinase [Arthrobacter tumbae]MBM7782107.1 rfaE bifunctional protein nucleotidyltransferase chain/domain/rfaE bifunctional protein kinase chain/domain [Arthrobacter tumbae]
MRIVVVGDVLLDVDLSGDASRLSPDAPVPVVDVAAARRRAGGAGLVARMLQQDAQEGRQGTTVELVTVLSDDDAAATLRAELADIPLVTGPSGAPTPVKTRIRAGGHAIVRFDEGCAEAPVPPVTGAMLRAVESADVVLVSDYGRGLAANPELRELLERIAGRIPVVWDPHPSGPDPVPGVAAVTPNLSEALKAAGAAQGGRADTVREAADAAAVLERRWQSKAVIVTLGERGALLHRRGEGAELPHLVPAPAIGAADPCGAGDRFCATLALALGAGAGIEEATQTAVQRAAGFLSRGGVSALGQEPEPTQLHGPAVDALRVARETREASGTVVATGGCFDLLHAGHARTLSAARRLGDCLIVCLNSDESVRRLKGAQRPIMGEDDRAELLGALECVDAVFVFGEDTPEEALAVLRPDIWVKGGDYSAAELPESALLRSWGGQTVTVPYIPARSTTSLAAALAEVG